MMRVKFHPAQPDNYAACYDPSVMGIVSIAGTVLSGVVGAAGKIMEGQSEADAYRYNAQVMRNNAQIAKQNAVFATEIGESQATQQGMRARAIVGAQKAAQAASGIDVNTGSAVDVRTSTAAMGELDALTIRSNAARHAYGYQVAATSDIAESNLDKFAASNASTAGYIGAFSSLLGGATSAGSQYNTWSMRNDLAALQGVYMGQSMMSPGAGLPGIPGMPPLP